MKDTILGYDWTDIQRAQQGGRLSPTIDTSKPAASGAPTDADLALLAEHGADGLETLGYHGVLDRLRRHALVTPPESPQDARDPLDGHDGNGLEPNASEVNNG